MTNAFYTTYFSTEDGLAHACDPTASFVVAVDAYAESRDDGYPAEVFLINLVRGTAETQTERANRRVIKRCRDRSQDLPEWLT